MLMADQDHQSGERTDNTKYSQLAYLLQQTDVYSKFLADKLSKQSIADPSTTDTVHDKPLFSQPSLMTGGTLRRFQLEGVEWLVTLYENGLNGILADEMGLGKTVQCIAFLAFLVEQGVEGPFLVVGPLSTIRNWQSEFTRFCPTLRTLLYHGATKDRGRLKQPSSLRDTIVITSYETVIRDLPFLKQPVWKFLVVDEGHRIKNIDCKLVRELAKLHTLNRLLLTGTPLQNSLAELWSLLHFLLPDVFDDLQSFESWFDIPEDGGCVFGPEQRRHVMASLHSILRPFLLRRLKSDVLGENALPSKQEFIVRCPPSALQTDLLEAAMQGNLRGKIADLDPGEEGEDEMDGAQNAAQQRLMNISMQCRKICNDPRLFGIRAGNQDSAKMKVCLQLVDVLVRDGHKVLIFSQMARMLDIVGEQLEAAAVKHTRIDGSVGEEDRAQRIAAFNSDPSIKAFLLTTRSGGLGLNLTAADTVILYDADWNPQADKQAADRVHRIGQARPVLVVRLRVAGSIEDRRMAWLTGQKERLERMVISRKRFKGRSEYLSRVDGVDGVDAVDGVDGVEYHDMPPTDTLSPPELDTIRNRTATDTPDTEMLKRVVGSSDTKGLP